jgi:predicted dehydrogenase
MYFNVLAFWGVSRKCGEVSLMIRYAVVGAGWITQEAFLPAVASSGNSKVTALVSSRPDVARRLSAFYDIDHIAPYDGYDALLERKDIDVVYVASPNPMHAEFAIRAARKGKHVLVEKPIATELSDARAMIEAARQSGVYLMTSYRLHNEPATLDALDVIRRGEIGDPTFISAIFSFQIGPGNHRLDSRQWGGPLPDIGIYCVNAARHIFESEPVEVVALTSRPQDDTRFREVDSSASVTIRFPRDKFVQFYCSFGASSVDEYRVVGSDGNIRMEHGFRMHTKSRMIVQSSLGEQIREYERVDHFGGQIAYLSECVMNGVRPETDGEEGLADLVVLKAVEEAARMRIAVPISLPPRPTHPTQSMRRSIPLTERRLLL